jgi:phytanoyl-CoA hydroxylase
MLDERIMNRVTAMIGPAFAAQSMFYFKLAGARGQALHQDNLFLLAHRETCPAAWIAIDDCDVDNGGLMVVPGSHR